MTPPPRTFVARKGKNLRSFAAIRHMLANFKYLFLRLNYMCKSVK